MQGAGVAMRREVSKESLVVSYIDGTIEVPRDLALLGTEVQGVCVRSSELRRLSEEGG